MAYPQCVYNETQKVDRANLWCTFYVDSVIIRMNLILILSMVHLQIATTETVRDNVYFFYFSR